MLAFCFVSFLAFGSVLVLVGSNQSHLAHALALDLSRTGLLASALAAGIGVGVVAAGPLFDRLPTRPLFVGALLLAAAGLATVSAGMPYWRWVVHLAVIGAGAGAYETLINASVVQRFGAGAPRPMSVIHAGAAVGAIATPFLADGLARNVSWIASFHTIGSLHGGLAVLALAVPFPRARPAPHEAPSVVRPWAVARVTAPFALIGFAYVGIEGSLIVFAEPYAGWLALDVSRGAFAISALWLGLLAGRLGVLGLRGTIDAGLLLAAGLVGTTLLLAGVATALPAIEAVFFAVGLSLGCVFPVMIALAGQRVPRARGLAAGLVAGAGAAGGFAIPWLTGALGDLAGIGAALASLALWSGVVAATALAVRQGARTARRAC